MTTVDDPVVAASEHDLIAMARALVAPHQHAAAPLFAHHRELPSTISPACADLLADTLRRAWPALWRRGRARGWQQHPPSPLAFSRATLQLLRWLVAEPLMSNGCAPLRSAPLTLGDQVLVYFALDAAGDTGVRATIAAQPFVRASPLAWLGFAHVLAGSPPAFSELATGAGAIVVEALAVELAARWRTVETSKRAIRQPAALIAMGAGQDATLSGFMTACRDRRELAAFIIEAAAPLLARGVGPHPVQLDPAAPLSARSAAREAAGALLRAVGTWREWDDQHRAVRFIDDDFARAQRLLARFEPIGRAGADRAVGWLADLASLAPTTPAPSDSIPS